MKQIATYVPGVSGLLLPMGNDALEDCGTRLEIVLDETAPADGLACGFRKRGKKKCFAGAQLKTSLGTLSAWSLGRLDQFFVRLRAEDNKSTGLLAGFVAVGGVHTISLMSEATMLPSCVVALTPEQLQTLAYIAEKGRA